MPITTLADLMTGRWNSGFGWHGIGPQSPDGNALDAAYSYTLSLTIVDAAGLFDVPAPPGASFIGFDSDFDVSPPAAAVAIPPPLARNVPGAFRISPAGDVAPSAAAASGVVGPFIQLGPAPSSGLTNTVQSGDNPPGGTVTGAVSVIVTSPFDVNTMWIGTPDGGIWVTHNHGTSWTPLTDKLASLSIASLSLDPTDPAHNTLIAGIGQVSNGAVGPLFLRGGPLTGLLYSTDGGTNWASLGGATLANQSVVGVAARGQVMLAGTFSPQTPNDGIGGLFRSIDGGANFAQVLATSGLPINRPVTSLANDPINNSRFYAAITGPAAASFAETGIYVSNDTGATWTLVFGAAQSNGIISATNQTVARVAAIGSEIAIGLVNVTTGKLAGLFLSTNSGTNFTSLAVPAINPGGQGVVNFAIALDPTTAGVVYITGDRLVNSPFTVQAFRVTTAGATSITDGQTGNNSSAHADSRSIAFDSSGNLILGSDGGIYARSNPTSSTGVWTGLNGSGLSIKETNAVAFDGNSDRLLIAGQDTGVGFENTPGGPVFTAVNGGDGVNAAVNDVTLGSNSALYHSSQSYGSLTRLIVNASGSLLGTASVFFSTNVNAQFASPFVLDNIDPSRIVLHTADIFVTQDTTLNFTTETSDFLNVTDIGTVGANNNAVAYGTQDNTQAILAGGDGSVGGRFLFLSTAATAAPGTLAPLTAYTGNAPSSVAFDLRTQNRFFVADQTDLYDSTNAGGSFNTLTANLTALNITSPTTVAFISNNGVNELLVGGLDSVANTQSTIAVADSDSAGTLTNFRLFGTGLPNTYVTALSYDVKSDVLAVGLFGRGGWVLTDVTSNFTTATVLRFGLANNDSAPDPSLLTGSRALQKFGTGTLTISGNATFTGGSTLNGGTMEIAVGATAGSSAIGFAAGTIDRLQIDGTAMPANTIAGFTSGDVIDLAGIAFNASNTVVYNGTNLLTVKNSGGTSLAQLTVSGLTIPAGDQLVLVSDGRATPGTDIVEQSVCFCRGTRILTETGEVAVEDLRVGDSVITLSGEAKPIVWIGIGRDLVTRANKLARPVIVRRGALADNVPARDLYLTHGHALYLDGVLIAVENLINHRSILWDESARVVEFYHLELEDHDVLLANGAPAESYYDASNRALFHNTRPGSEAGAAKPTFAPVLSGGEAVERVWAALFARSGGQVETDTTEDPDLHLVVDGKRLEALSVDARSYTFVLDAPPSGRLQLCSRSAVPSLLGVTRHDHRRLGVAISRIELRQPGVTRVLEHDAPVLREGGCHPPENGYCWSDGECALPAGLFVHLAGTFSLVVHIERPGMCYTSAAPLTQAA